MGVRKARLLMYIRKVFEEDSEKIEEEVSKRYNISKEELNPKKYRAKGVIGGVDKEGITRDDKVLSIRDYTGKKDGDEERVKRLVYMLKNDLSMEYKTLKLKINFDEDNPYGINFDVYNKDIQINFGIDKILDNKNKKELYNRVRDSRLEGEERVKKAYKNAELYYILECYNKAVKLNNKVGE